MPNAIMFATTTLLPFLQQQRQHDRTLTATEIILSANPNDVVAMTHRADAWYAKAEALGWRAWTDADWSRYLDHFAGRKKEHEPATE